MKYQNIVVLVCCILNYVYSTDRVRIWNSVPKNYVGDHVKNFINDKNITNCFEFVENDDYLKLKCWRYNKIINVNIIINNDKADESLQTNSLSVIV